MEVANKETAMVKVMIPIMAAVVVAVVVMIETAAVVGTM